MAHLRAPEAANGDTHAFLCRGDDNGPEWNRDDLVDAGEVACVVTYTVGRYLPAVQVPGLPDCADWECDELTGSVRIFVL